MKNVRTPRGGIFFDSHCIYHASVFKLRLQFISCARFVIIELTYCVINNPSIVHTVGIICNDRGVCCLPLFCLYCSL